MLFLYRRNPKLLGCFCLLYGCFPLLRTVPRGKGSYFEHQKSWLETLAGGGSKLQIDYKSRCLPLASGLVPSTITTTDQQAFSSSSIPSVLISFLSRAGPLHINILNTIVIYTATFLQNPPKSIKMVAPSSLWSIALLASASLVSGHGVIVRAQGDAGGQGSAIGGKLPRFQ